MKSVKVILSCGLNLSRLFARSVSLRSTSLFTLQVPSPVGKRGDLHLGRIYPSSRFPKIVSKKGPWALTKFGFARPARHQHDLLVDKSFAEVGGAPEPVGQVAGPGTAKEGVVDGPVLLPLVQGRKFDQCDVVGCHITDCKKDNKKPHGVLVCTRTTTGSPLSN